MNTEDRARLARVENLLVLVLDQLAGYKKDEAGNHIFSGWEALGESPDPEKDGLTLVDGVAALRHDVADLRNELAGGEEE